MSEDSDSILNLYYDHYKDTQEIIRSYIAKRDKYTIILLCVVAVISYVAESIVTYEITATIILLCVVAVISYVTIDSSIRIKHY